MPDYEIEDSETGLKLVVAGDSEPTQEEADELIRKEYSDISTNIFKLPDGKFYLDVGPLVPHRQIYDSMSERIAKSDAILGSHESAKKFADQNYQPSKGGWGKLYDEQKDRFSKTNQIQFTPVAQEIMNNVSPGTLVINAHGSKGDTKMYTDWGHEFTINNVAKLLKDQGAISNVVNMACYGASCKPQEYEAAFPGLSSIRHIDTNYPNTMNLKSAKSGEFFSHPEVKWVKTPQGWVQENPTPLK